MSSWKLKVRRIWPGNMSMYKSSEERESRDGASGTNVGGTSWTTLRSLGLSWQGFVYLTNKSTLITLAYSPNASLSCYPPCKNSECNLCPTEEEMTKNEQMCCLVFNQTRLFFVYPRLMRQHSGVYIMFLFNTIWKDSFVLCNSKLVFYIVMTYRGFEESLTVKKKKNDLHFRDKIMNIWMLEL